MKYLRVWAKHRRKQSCVINATIWMNPAAPEKKLASLVNFTAEALPYRKNPLFPREGFHRNHQSNARGWRIKTFIDLSVIRRRLTMSR